jgi:hypothetical protein
MVIKYQSAEGHTILEGLTDLEVTRKFRELTMSGFTAFADTRLAEPVGPIKTVEEARDLGAEELFFIAPLQGG